MVEKFRQENFEDTLFGPPTEPGKPVEAENGVKETETAPEPERENIRCPYCEDVGVCSFCARGKAEANKLPPVDLYKKHRKKKK